MRKNISRALTAALNHNELTLDHVIVRVKQGRIIELRQLPFFGSKVIAEVLEIIGEELKRKYKDELDMTQYYSDNMKYRHVRVPGIGGGHAISVEDMMVLMLAFKQHIPDFNIG